MIDNTFLQTIFQSHFEQYAAKHKSPLKYHKAAYAFMACKTNQLGSSYYICDKDQSREVIHHSCRHRSCPQCAAKKQQRWLLKQQEKLLKCPHYHAVFTLPHEYLELWQFNTYWHWFKCYILFLVKCCGT